MKFIYVIAEVSYAQKPNGDYIPGYTITKHAFTDKERAIEERDILNERHAPLFVVLELELDEEAGEFLFEPKEV